jgi:copper(I)-binding protein
MIPVIGMLQAAMPACGDRSEPAGLVVERAWVRAVTVSGPGGVTTAAYMRILNRGPADRLVGATAEAAGRAELHRTVIDGSGLAMMGPAGPLDLPSGSTTELEPGGLHLMLMDVRDTLSPGDTVPIVLRFESGFEADVGAEVRAF